MNRHRAPAELLDSHGIKTQQVKAQAFPLTGDALYIVRSGEVNLYCCSIKADGSYGKRMFAAQFTENDILFPATEFTYRTEKVLLFADGAQDTEILRIDADIQQLFKCSEEISHRLHKAFYDWIERLSASLAEDEIPPSCKIISLEEIERSNGIFSFDAHTEFRPAHGIIWVSVKEGFCVICGEEENVLMAEGSIFPLSHKLWMKTLDKSILELRPASAVFNEGLFRKFLKAFYDSFFKIFLLTDVYRTDSAKNIKERLSELEKKALDTSISKLAELSEKKETQRETGNILENACMTALSAAGRALKTRIRLPDKFPASKDSEDTIIKILENSSVYYRKVSLRENWHKNEGSVMIGFESDTGIPAAFIYSRKKGYRIYHGETNSFIRISDERAEKIKDYAYELYPQFNKKTSFQGIISFMLQGSEKDFFLAAFIAAAAGTAALAQPYLTEGVFNSVIPHAEILELVQIVIVLLTATISSTLFTLCRSFITLRIKTISEHRLQSVIISKMLGAPVSSFKDYSSGNLAQRTISAENMHNLLTGTLTEAVFAFSASIPAFILMVYYNCELALTGLFFVSVFTGIVGVKAFVNRKEKEKELHARGELSSFVVQAIRGITKIRLSVSENRVFVKWAAKFAELGKSSTKEMENRNFLIVINSIYPIFMTGLFFYLAGEKWKDLFTIGEYLAFISAFTLFMTGAAGFCTAIPAFFSMKTHYSKLKPILEAAAEADGNMRGDLKMNGKIELKNISYRYNQGAKLILNDLNLTIQQGEHIVITGPSGAGKSTLLRVLLGFEIPEKGTLQYNGQDINLFSKRELRKQLGAVFQNDTLIHGSIFQNIAGNNNVSIEQAMAAAVQAGLEEDMKQFPMGIHTIVTDANVSGGQKQKILIAEVLLRKPHLIILDEAMSAIDNEAKRLIMRNLKALKATLLIVTNDRENLKDADKIFAMINGKTISL